MTDVALGAEKSGAICTARLEQTSTAASTGSSVFSLPLRTHRLMMTWHDPIRMRWEPWLETATDFVLRR